MIRNRFILLALLCWMPHSGAQNPQPLWETNLAKFGYQGRLPAALAHLPEIDLTTHFGTAIYSQGVVFTDSNVAVAYFVVHDDPPGAVEPRTPLFSDPFRLVAVFLDVQNGEVTKKLEWPLPANSQCVSANFFSAAGKGRFLVGLGNTLDLYSREFKLLAHLDLPSEPSLIVSASGESLLLRTENQVDGQWITHYELRETAKTIGWRGPGDPRSTLKLLPRSQRNCSPTRGSFAGHGSSSLRKSLRVQCAGIRIGSLLYPQKQRSLGISIWVSNSSTARSLHRQAAKDLLFRPSDGEQAIKTRSI